jgi:hypothetical protein
MVISGVPTWGGTAIGAVIALLVLLVDVVLLVTGQIELRLGLLIGGLALARLL